MTTAIRLRTPANRVPARAIALWALDSLVQAAFTVGVAAFIAWWITSAEVRWVPQGLTGNAWRIVWALAVLLAVTVVVEPIWRYAVHRWELAADVMYARTGWVTRQWVFVPVSRIQTVDTKQGVLERMLNLATLDVRTASHLGSTSIAGLDYGVASRLAEELSTRAHELRDDAT